MLHVEASEAVEVWDEIGSGLAPMRPLKYRKGEKSKVYRQT
jgi:hypothetical protein